MKAIHWITAAAALACAEPVRAGINDPEVIIYRFPGVHDNGGSAGAGAATVFHCTNVSGVTEIIRFVLRNEDSSIVANQTFTLQHLRTIVVGTHGTFAYFNNISLSEGVSIITGTMAIAATSINVFCTAMTIDAGGLNFTTFAPVGVALRGIRFNPIPGSQD